MLAVATRAPRSRLSEKPSAKVIAVPPAKAAAKPNCEACSAVMRDIARNISAGSAR